LALQKSFGSESFCRVGWGWQNAQQSLTNSREKCNEYDLIALPCFWLVKHNDWSWWFAIGSLPPYLQSQF
jgi:hypothetical protein